MAHALRLTVLNLQGVMKLLYHEYCNFKLVKLLEKTKFCTYTFL